MTTRSDIVRIARTWIGTPYHHQASLKGVGADCFGMIHGIYHEITGRREKVPAYTQDWGDTNGRETLLNAARDHLDLLKPGTEQPGDILLFKWDQSAVVKHAAVLSYDNQIIHAYSGAAVHETHFAGYWKKRQAAAFAFRGIV